MKRIYLLFTGLILSLGIHAQSLDLSLLENMKARAIGPAGMSGRVTSIDVVNNQTDIMYVGTASGGVWKSTSGGVDWFPIFEHEAVSSIGAIAIQQSNPDVIWAGTGEGNPRNSLTGGYGLYKSIDAGKNWKLVGLEKTRNIHRIIIDPTDPNTVYIGAIGSPWGEHPERGVYKTTDGGENWERVLFVNESTGAADLVMDPNNPNKLIAAMWEHKRQPWTFNSGGPGSGMYITYDGGKNWEKRTAENGLPKGELGRMGLAIAPSNSKRVYALIESKKNAFYRSDDGGFNWKKINDKPEIGNRPFYYSDIFVDPVNENRIYSVFTYVNVSEDGGKSFSELMPAYGTSKGVHPDHHAWWIHPEDPKFMMDGNDGGLNITRDHGKTWRFVENLPVGQFYHVNVDNDFPYNVYGGMQDNGSWAGPAYVLKAQGIRNSYWQELMFGDGFDVVPDPKNSRYGYGMSQQGFVGRYDRQTGDTKFIQPTHPNPDVRLRFNWNSAIAMDPTDQHTLYFGSQFVHKSTDKGDTWELISPDLTTNDPEKQKQHESGGITMDATGAENHTTILAISPSNFDPKTIWAGTDDGNVQITRDGGKTWTNVAPNIKGMPAKSWVPQIKTSTFNEGEAYVVVNNYRQFDFMPYLFRTRDYGKTWERLLADQPETFGYVHAIVQDPEEQKLLFLGSENGLYVSIDEGKNWTKWTNGFPTVPTMDLVIHPREQDLVIGTFGRAFYVLDDIRPLREIARQGTGLFDKDLVLFAPPTGVQTINQQPSGTRFGANAMFNGENRPSGARISYYIKVSEDKAAPSSKKKSKKKKSKDTEVAQKSTVNKDSIFLTIYNDKGEAIRNIKRKAPKKDGLYRTSWFMEKKGVARASRSIPKKNAREPYGNAVMPGKYKLEMTFAGQTSSQEIEVILDPRKTWDLEGLAQKDALLTQIDEYRSMAANSTAQLARAKKIVSDYSKRISEADPENKEELMKAQKEISKKIDGYFDSLLGKRDKRQGITRNPEPTALSYLNTARRYANGLNGAPTSTETTLFDNAKLKLEPVLTEITTFFNEDWKAYQKKMESMTLSPFEQMETK
ncbi:MAG: VPS10 domain-containing protein [Flavobacteriaceae bacterium]